MLNVVSKDEAVKVVADFADGLSVKTEYVSVTDSLGRTLSEDIVSKEDIPSFDRTTVDGYAVISSDTFGAGNSVPAQLETVGEILMGEKADFTLSHGQCARISTGGMLPKGADAAVMVEQTDNADGLCLVYKSVAPFENVTKTGDDISIGETALKKGTVINSACVGVIAALGIENVPVYKKPVIAIISTGDEIASGEIRQGQIRDINTFLLSAAVREYGCEVYSYGAVKDSREQIENAVRDCVEKADAVLISGGSSAGARDMTVDIIDTLGKAYFHGIAMKPGKPTIFGVVDNKPVFGLPGHPLAAYFVFRLIVTEYIRKIMNMPPDKPKRNGVLAVNIPSNHGREEYLCIKYNENNEVVPVHTKSGVISVLSKAEGFIKIDRNAEGLFKGTGVEIYEL
jgi:molybdopterin molybdotransferase